MDLTLLSQEWLIYLRSGRSVSKHTVAAYHHDWQQFIAFFQTYCGHPIDLPSLKKIKITDLRSWLADRYQQDFNTRSTARSLSGVKNFFRFLQQQGLLDCHPIFMVRPPRLKRTLPRPLSTEQTLTLLKDIPQISQQKWVGQRDRALFILIYSTGLRLGEALSLNYDVLKARQYLTIQGKGDKCRQVPFLPMVQAELQQYCQLCPFPFQAHTPLFLGIKGQRLSLSVADRQMQRYRELAGLPDWATPHALRHSCATHLMRASGDLRGIQELLGHASLSTTQIYTDVDNKHLMRVYQAAHPRSKS